MATLLSKYFGTLSYSVESVFRFPWGIPAFEDQTEFVFLDQPHTAPLVFMQSLGQPDLCFITVPVRVACSGYQFVPSPEDLRLLGLPADSCPKVGEDILCLALVNVAEGADPTANLSSPIVLNLRDRIGLQAVQESPAYSCRHPLIPREELIAC